MKYAIYEKATGIIQAEITVPTPPKRVWDGKRWISDPRASGGVESPTAPDAPEEGHVWIDTSRLAEVLDGYRRLCQRADGFDVECDVSEAALPGPASEYRIAGGVPARKTARDIAEEAAQKAAERQADIAKDEADEAELAARVRAKLDAGDTLGAVMLAARRGRNE